MAIGDVRGERWALPVSALSLGFSAVVLPLVYLTVPFCRPLADLGDLTTTIGIVSGASALAFTAIFLSLLSVYTLGNVKSRASLAMAAGSLAITTAFLVFGLALRSCAW